ncbi:MAG TPA: hypothetical protein VGT60_05175 [Candidatus Limnocylindria bacterium]|nr:hypothetical protein [Candidatus Limnocylindria bacterium]
MVAGGAIAIGALAALGLVSAATRRTRRGTGRAVAVAAALRRGAMAGCAVALLALLRVVDGLTPLTAVFVIAPFVVAEAVLATRRG